MDQPIYDFFRLINSNAFPKAGLAIGLLCLLGLILITGRRLDFVLRLEQIGIPVALVAGSIALFIGPYGLAPILPERVTDIWIQLPTPLLTLVFATLLLGRPLPKGKGLWQPVGSQVLLALLLGFGQYLVAGLAVLYVLIPRFGVDPLMGCLIEVGFEGGHGAAAVMGESFLRLGYPAGLDLGLAMATVGLLSSTVIGSALVVLGRWLGWVVPQSSIALVASNDEEFEATIFQKVSQLAINLALVGIAVGFGVIGLAGLRHLSPYLGEIYAQVIHVFPVFPLALLGSLAVRIILEVLGQTQFVSQLLQREIATLATDLLIITAMASLNLPLLQHDWVPLVVLSLAGLTWNLAGMFIFARLNFRRSWFERSIAEFGNATGVAASGLLLLRLADPRNITNTLPIFSIKQLLLQPLLSGGVITVIAPLAITQIGLLGWTQLCGVITAIFFFVSLFLQDQPLELLDN